MRSPTTAGGECPGGSGTFQTTPVSGPMSGGSGVASGQRPAALGPRSCGQSAAGAMAAPRRTTDRTAGGFIGAAGAGGGGKGEDTRPERPPQERGPLAEPVSGEPPAPI